MHKQQHWQQVYQTKAITEVSWYQPDLAFFWQLLADVPIPKSPRAMDIGAGASGLIDQWLDAGWSSPVALDISSAALQLSQQRLGARASQVRWQVADIAEARFAPQSVELWHDRAVFHFLTEPHAQQQYIQLVSQTLVEGGIVILGTFALDGPERCSQLPVCRYDADMLTTLFGPKFAFIKQQRQLHKTPWGSVQPFQYVVLQRLA